MKDGPTSYPLKLKCKLRVLLHHGENVRVAMAEEIRLPCRMKQYDCSLMLTRPFAVSITKRLVFRSCLYLISISTHVESFGNSETTKCVNKIPLWFT